MRSPRPIVPTRCWRSPARRAAVSTSCPKSSSRRGMSSSIAQQAQALRARETTAVELTRRALDAARVNAPLNALITQADATALAAAERADAALTRGAADLLCGIPFVHK